MKLMKNKCYMCTNSVPEEPANIVINSEEHAVCEECERLLETIAEKVAEINNRDIDEKYESF